MNYTVYTTVVGNLYLLYVAANNQLDFHLAQPFISNPDYTAN